MIGNKGPQGKTGAARFCASPPIGSRFEDENEDENKCREDEDKEERRLTRLSSALHFFQ